VASFDLAALIQQRGDERYELQARYVNPQLARMLHAIGFDKIYTRAEGAYLYDDAGNEYLDMLAGFGVFALGRHHPVVRPLPWPVCSPRSCWPGPRISTASTSATAAPRQSRRH
jgi:hypothetical protein